ncbi:MAG: serine/threonine-protein phosphatase [Oscillospiraceae bacterium]|jgi:stage II sporulation protein E|nr:serine/threonine-protein phosphatase [Oscillospiraceae bacterium]
MTVLEFVRERQTGWDSRKLLTASAANIGAAALGIVLAQTGVAGGVFAAGAPFAVALAAACSVRWLIAPSLGALLGSLAALSFPGAVPVWAAIAAAALTNAVLQRLGLRRRRLAAALTAGACSLTAGLSAAFSGGRAGGLPILMAVGGAALSACAAYFIQVTRGIRRVHAGGGKGSGEEGFTLFPYRLLLTRQECAALLLCCAMVMTALGCVSVGGFVPVSVLAVLFVLICAVTYREMGGAAAGAAAGAAMLLATADPLLIGILTLGGLFAGLCAQEESDVGQGQAKARSGKRFGPGVLAAGSFLLICTLFTVFHAVLSDRSADAMAFFLESLAAASIFAALPRSAVRKLRATIAPESGAGGPGAARMSDQPEAQLRLVHAAGSVRKVAAYVSEVTEGLQKLDQPILEGVCVRAEEEVCGSCPRRKTCAAGAREPFEAFFRQIQSCLRDEDGLSPERVTGIHAALYGGESCARAEQLSAACCRAYFGYLARTDCHEKGGQIRQAAADQFEALAEMLEDLGMQLAQVRGIDDLAAAAAARALGECGLRVHRVSCVQDADGIVTLTAEATPAAEIPDRDTLAAAVSAAAGCLFSAPSVCALQAEGAELLLTFAQRPLYHINLGAVQMSSAQSAYCGDYFDHFEDGRGRELLVISDGMGTGGRAAIDAALATEIFGNLVRSGLSFGCAMRVANAALMVKSPEETLATLDVAGIDLYSGQVEFCKAGGTVSFLLQGGKANRLELSALPAGILRGIRPAGCTVSLAEGDIVVLLSDGLLADSGDWICAALERWRDQGDMQALAEHLTELAVTRRGDAREDDMTVLCAQLRE